MEWFTRRAHSNNSSGCTHAHWQQTSDSSLKRSDHATTHQRSAGHTCKRKEHKRKYLYGLSGPLLFAALFCAVFVRQARAWVTLTQEGYAFEHKLLAQAGVRIAEDLKIAGLAVSSPEAQLRCNPSRRGALRWSEDNSDFEACDGENDWRPLLFCDVDCSMSLDTVPCGIPVRNMCDRECNRVGQGLNVRQCILNVGHTPCGEPVVDNCNNVCGLQGQAACDEGKDAVTVGSMEIKSMSDQGSDYRSSYRLSVGRLSKEAPPDGELDNALYLDIISNPNPAGLSEVEADEERNTILKMKYIEGPAEGLEMESPTSDGSYMMRVSMYSELTGGYVKLGDVTEDAETGKLAHFTHIYLDGIVENAHRGWMPKHQGSRSRAHEAQRALVSSSEDYQQQLEHAWNMSQVRDRQRARGRSERVEFQEGMMPTAARHWLPYEDAEDPHVRVDNGFRLDEDLESDLPWGFRDCPFLFNGGAPKDHSDLGAGNFVRVCLDTPSRPQRITLPDAKPDPLSAPMRQVQFGTRFEAELDTRKANEVWSAVQSFGEHGWEDSLSGMVITSGNAHDLAGLPGLRELSTMVYRGRRERAEDSARVECCTTRGNETVCEFDCTAYQHAWSSWNASDNSSVAAARAAGLSEDLSVSTSLPWWFLERRLLLADSPGVNGTEVPFWNETYTAPSNISAYRDCAVGASDCTAIYASFVARPEPDVLEFQTEINGRNVTNETLGWEPPSGCAVFNFSSVYFDVFRVHYDVEGWEMALQDLADRVVERFTVRFPIEERGNVTNCTTFPVTLTLEDGNVTVVNETRCVNSTIRSEGSFVANVSSRDMDASLNAALHIQQLLHWKAFWESERAAGLLPSGRLIWLGGLKHATWLEGYYERTGERSNGRPVLKHQHADYFLYSTTEWFSADPIWAAGPSLDLSEARLRVYSQAVSPELVQHGWSEWSDEFPVGLHFNTDARATAVDMNVTTPEFEVAWGQVWGFANFSAVGIGEPTDAERCFVCCCRSHNETNNETWHPETVCNAAPAWAMPSEVEPELECHRTELGTVCVNATSAPNATVTVEFETPQNDRFLQFPSASGSIITTGNLKDITSLGVQGAPVLGYSRRTLLGEATVVHLHFGGDEEAIWPLAPDMCMAAHCSADDGEWANKPEQLLGCHCDPRVERRDSSLWESAEERAELLRRRSAQEPSTIGNNLQLPSRADGILLTTGNLEDVTVSSGAMTGLNVATDIEVGGFLQFGSGGHAGECGWTECNARDHTQTSGFVLPTTDMLRGWARLPKTQCSNIATEAMHGGALDPDTAVREGAEVCGTAGSGRHCFRLVNGSLGDCLNACAEEPCSILLASRFNLVELWWNSSQALSVSEEGALQVQRLPTEGRPSMAWEMARFHCNQGLDPGDATANSRDFPIELRVEPELDCLVFFRTRTMAATSAEPLAPVYIAGGEDRSSAAQLAQQQNQKAVLEAEMAYMRFIRACVSTTFCVEGITWPGGETSRLALDTNDGLCDAPPDQTEFAYDGRVLSCQSTEEELAASGIESRYSRNVDELAATNAEIGRLEDFITSSPPSLDTVPHLWRMRPFVDPNNTHVKQFSLHHEGFCMELREGETQEFTCGVGGEIVEITAAFFGDPRGMCGEYEPGSCSVDVRAKLQRGPMSCAGNSSCIINASSVLWFESEEQREACAGQELTFKAQAVCKETPLLLLDQAEESDPIFMIQLPEADGSIAVPPDGVFQIGYEDRIECIADRALPARIQESTCGPLPQDHGDVYLFGGFKGNLTFLIADGQNASGTTETGEAPKTMLQFEAQEASNSVLQESEVLFPATNGIVLSTGNLEDITAESGYITSLQIKQDSFFRHGITVGRQEALREWSEELEAYVHSSWWAYGNESGSPAQGGSRYLWNDGPWLTLFGVGECTEDLPQFGVPCETVEEVYNETVTVDETVLVNNETVTVPRETVEVRRRTLQVCPEWKDADGFGCEHYAANGWCGRSINVNKTSFNLTADTVCCACRASQIDESIKYNTSDGAESRLRFKARPEGVAQIEFPVAWGVQQGVSMPHGYSDITGGVFSMHLCTDPAGSPDCEARVITTGNLEDVRNVSAQTINVSGPARLLGPLILGSGVEAEPLRTPSRSPPGAFGQAAGSRWSTFDSEWGASTAAALSRGSEMSGVVFGGAVAGGIAFRHVPRERSPGGLHAQESPDGVRFVLWEWTHVPGRTCRMLQHADVAGQEGVSREPGYSHSQRRKGEPREAVTKTYSLAGGVAEECREMCSLNPKCGVVSYTLLPLASTNATQLVDCTLSFVPASTCNLASGSARQGVWLLPRNESIHLNVRDNTQDRVIAFPGSRSGVVITSENPTDIAQLRGLRNTGINDPLVHSQPWHLACRGLSEAIPECSLQFRSVFHKCMLARFPNWGGYGEFVDGDCDFPEYNAQLANISAWKADPANGMPEWTSVEQTPQLVVDWVVAGERCRGRFSGFDLMETLPEARAQIQEAGYEMTDICSNEGCATCQPYVPDGALPDYLDPGSGERVHEPPADSTNRRITFPDASGTVITSGNADDVVFKSMRLEGLELNGYAYFGQVDENSDFRFDSDEPVRIRFAEEGHALRFTGPLNLLAGTNFENPEALEAYGAPGEVPPKPSGKLAGVVSQRTITPYRVCVSADPAACTWPTEGQGDCPRVAVANGTLPPRESDCEAPEEACAGAGSVCRETFLCQGGTWSGQPCAINAHCCARSATGVLRNDCVFRCVGQKEYLARPERGGFHTLTYLKRPTLLEADCRPGQSCTAGQPSDDFWIGESELFDGLYYTQLVYEDPTANNTIVLPDVSGTILTTGNLIDLPAMDLAQGTLYVGGHTGVRGDLMLGGPDTDEPMEMHSWLDGDTGITFRTAGGCSVVAVSGVQRHPEVEGEYRIESKRFDRKPVWKHLDREKYIFFKNNVGLGPDGLTQGEGRWYVGDRVGAAEGVGFDTPLQLRMKRLSWSPVDPDEPFPKEKPGSWEEWDVRNENGQWFLEDSIAVTCAVAKETLHHLRVSVPQRPGQDVAVRHYLREAARALPIPVLQRIDAAETKVELYADPLPGSRELSVRECSAIMLGAGAPGSHFCPSSDNCVETFDTRPTSVGAFARFLEAEGLVRPTLVQGGAGAEVRAFSAVTRRWTGCVLDGEWDLSPAVKLRISAGSGEVEWGETRLAGLAFRREGPRLVSDGSWANAAGAAGTVMIEVASNCTQMYLQFALEAPPPGAVVEERKFELRRCDDAPLNSPRCFGEPVAEEEGAAPPFVRERVVYDAAGSVELARSPLFLSEATAWLALRADVRGPADVFVRSSGARADRVAKSSMLELVAPGECTNASALWPRCAAVTGALPAAGEVFEVGDPKEGAGMEEVASGDWARWREENREEAEVAGVEASTHCTVGVELGGNGTEVTGLRFAPRKGGAWLLLGGVFQAASGLDDNSVVDLHVVRTAPKEGEFTLAARMPEETRGLRARWVWFVGAKDGACDALLRVEVHSGSLSRVFVPYEAGTDSYFVDDDAIRSPANVQVAMVSKCAGMGWFPLHQRADVGELAMPAASGVMLGTGNLADISIEAGPVTGLSVRGKTEIRGNLELGSLAADSIASLDAQFSGAQPLSFGRVPGAAAELSVEGCGGEEEVVGGGGEYTASTSFRLGLPSGSNFLVMSGSLGTVLTRGDEHYALDGEGDAVLIGQTSITGSLLVDGNSTVGSARASPARKEYSGWDAVGQDAAAPQTESSTVIRSEVMGDFPATFRGKFKAQHVEEGTSLGVLEGRGQRRVVLPDVSGTIVSAGELPPLVHEMTGAGMQTFDRIKFEGGPAAGESDAGRGRGRQIVFGGGEKRVEVEINAVVRMRGGLEFEGELGDGRRTVLEVQEPASNNVLTLPDADGTVLTTSSLPETLDEVRVLGELSVMEAAKLGANAGDTVRFGAGVGGRQSTDMQHATVSGRFPLSFSAAAMPPRSGGSGGNSASGAQAEAPSTTFEMMGGSGSTVVSFADGSGTVITTGNLEAYCKVPYAPEYAIESASLSLVAAAGFALGSAAEAVVAGTAADGSTAEAGADHSKSKNDLEGSFVFTDATEGGSEESSRLHVGPDQFVVQARGGVRFVSGALAGGREVGVQLQPMASGWAVLSDQEAKEGVQALDGKGVAARLAGGSVPVSRWRYEGSEETHMGPMAQEFAEAFGLGGATDRISTVDADGVALAAGKGMWSYTAELEAQVEALELELAQMMAGNKRNRAQMDRNAAALRQSAQLLQELESRFQTLA